MPQVLPWAHRSLERLDSAVSSSAEPEEQEEEETHRTRTIQVAKKQRDGGKSI